MRNPTMSKPYRILILIWLFMFACSGPQIKMTKEDQGPPPARTDCSTSRDFFGCLREKSKLWEKRENAESQEETISETQDGPWKLTKTRICFADFCHAVGTKDYDPSFKDELKSDAGWVSVGIIIGALGVVAAAHAAPVTVPVMALIHLLLK